MTFKDGVYHSNFPTIELPPPELGLWNFLTSKERADVPWLIDSANGRTLTYKQAIARAEDIAKGFYSMGLREKETVVVYSSNEVDYATSLWGTFRIGGICSCANPSYSAAELGFQVEMVNKHFPVRVILVHPDSIEEAIKACEKAKLSTKMIILIKPSASKNPTAAKFPTLDDLIEKTKRSTKLPPKVKLDADAIAFLSFSSGTTGLPKAVTIAHRNVVSNILQFTAHMDNTLPYTPYNPETKQGDVVMGVLPFFHIYGLVVVLHTSVYMNVPVVCHSKFTLPSYLQAVEKYKCSLLYLVPPIVILLVKSDTTKDYDLSSVRMIMAGAAPLSGETLDGLTRKYPKISAGQGWGMTETSTVVTMFDPSRPKECPPASAGIIIPNCSAKIVSPEGNLLPPGAVGELWVKSPSNAMGYLANDKATRETFDSEGFVHTGDECFIDENGFMHVVDRIKELIKVSGNQVAPAELEGHLLSHPLINNVCVIGIPDDYTGEKPKAYVVLTEAGAQQLKKGSQEEAKIVESIKKHVSDHKIKYKWLQQVEFLDVIPSTASGKLLRKDLRARHAQSEKNKTKL